MYKQQISEMNANKQTDMYNRVFTIFTNYTTGSERLSLTCQSRFID